MGRYTSEDGNQQEQIGDHENLIFLK
jgi:hypothetical protein